jgi:hypothetical protein
MPVVSPAIGSDDQFELRLNAHQCACGNALPLAIVIVSEAGKWVGCEACAAILASSLEIDGVDFQMGRLTPIAQG